MQETYENIRRRLDDAGVTYTAWEHEPVFTSEQAARVRGADLRTGVKALLVKTSDGAFRLVLVRADRRANLEAVASLEGARKVRLAKTRDVARITGCEVGSVPPFGFEIRKTYMDRTILENEVVHFNAGLHTVTIRMRAEDLVRMVAPVLYG